MSEPNAGVRHLQHFLPRQEGRRELADQRQTKILVHLRRRRRLHDHHRAPPRTRPPAKAPSRPLDVLPREEAWRAAARLQRRADSQDRLFRLEDLRARLRQLPRPGREHDRRGRPGLLLRPPQGSRRRAPTPRRVPSAWPRARSTIRSSTPATASSSAARLATSRRSAFKNRRGMATQIEAARASSTTSSASRSIPASAATRKASMVKTVRLGDGPSACAARASRSMAARGYTTLHAVERHWRDARLTKIFEGTSEIQKRIISDRLLGRGRN